MAMDKEAMDTMLCELDDDSIEQGGPVLSAIVCHDDGTVSTAFWRTVEKHKLRLPGESDAACVVRHIAITHAFYEG